MKRVLLIILVLSAGWIGGYFTAQLQDTTQKTFSLVNPNAHIEYPVNKQTVEYSDLKEELETAIREEHLPSNVSVSLYVRAFGSGQWLGVNEDAKYAPASLLKVPLMIAYFKAAQADNSILSRKLKYAGGKDLNEGQAFKPSTTLTPGYYTIDELINRMIINSGNNSQELLEKNIDLTFFKEVYTDLGLPFPSEATEVDFMSPKEFALPFRMLYNISYLNGALSQKALELLTATEFTEGIVAGVDPNIRVAHKFGERAFDQKYLAKNPSVSPHELHDCGIVYAIDNPYLICIMTKGPDLATLKHMISKLSAITYRKLSHT